MQPAAEPSPQQQRALALRQLFEAALKSPDVKDVGGNILVFVPNVATWTLVTVGSRPTLHDYASADPVHFAISCDDMLLVQLMTGADVDFAEAVESGRLKLQGDVNIFIRLVECIPA